MNELDEEPDEADGDEADAGRAEDLEELCGESGETRVSPRPKMQRSVGAVLPLRSGLVQRLTRWMLFFANSWSGSITSVLISLILQDCQG